MMDKAQVIDNIRQVASSVLPQGSKLFLYGSRAPLLNSNCCVRAAYLTTGRFFCYTKGGVMRE